MGYETSGGWVTRLPRPLLKNPRSFALWLSKKTSIIKKSMNVLEHIYQKTIFPLHFLGLDISITTSVVALWLAALISFLFFLFAARSLKLVPGKMQNLAEAGVVFLRDEVASQISQDRGQWLPFLVVLFCFILANNLLGLFPGVSSATTNINVTATLAIIVFVVVQVAGVVKQGVSGYLKSFLPKDVAWPIMIFLVPVEFVSQLAKPFSLALRLFANMFAGHAVMLLIISLIFIFRSVIIVPFPVVGEVAIMGFEIFVAFIQAFVFTYLSALYIATAQAGY